MELKVSSLTLKRAKLGLNETMDSLNTYHHHNESEPEYVGKTSRSFTKDIKYLIKYSEEISKYFLKLHTN